MKKAKELEEDQNQEDENLENDEYSFEDATIEIYEYSPEEMAERKFVADQVQDDINFLIKELKKHSSPKVLDSLLSSLEILVEYSNIVGLDVKVDDLYCVLGQNKYEKIIKRYKDNLYNHSKNMFKLNKIISYNVDQMFESNGYIPFSVRYRKIIDPIKMAGDFFKDYDKDLYDFFKLELERRHYFDWLLEPSTGGCTIDIPVKDKSYILLNNLFEDNILKASIVCHETIHAYFNHLQKFRDYDSVLKSQINNLNEVYSTFIQMAFVEWLKKINYKSKDLHALDNHNKYMFKEFNDSLSSKLYQFEDFLDKKIVDDYYNNEGEMEKIEGAFATAELLKGLGQDVTADELLENPELCTIEFEYPKDFTKYDAAQDIITPESYFYGYLLGFHFLNQYLEDPNKAKENITNFTIDSAKKDKLELLNGYGLGLDNLKDTNKIKKLIYTKDYFK